MSRDDFDLGPLTWVKGEIDQALASVLDLVVKFRDRPEDSASLRFMSTHLHQVNGALDMVGLEGAKFFCQELESVIDRLGNGQLKSSEELVAAFSQGVRTLGAYLDDLVNGVPDIPLRLFPALSALAVAQGKESPEESALFFPDTSIRAPSDVPFVEIDESALPQYLAEQRRSFQRALLNWLRKGADAPIAEMREVVDAVGQSQRLSVNKTLWWVASAALDAIRQNGANAGLQAIRVFRRLDQQLRLLIEGTSRPANALMRDLLFQVAKAAPDSDRIRQVIDRFELQSLLPYADVNAAQMHQPGGESAALSALRALMPRLKEAWEAVAETGSGDLPAVLSKLHEMEASRQALSNASLSELLLTVLKTVERLSDDPAALSADLALDVASALTLSENALENYAYLSKDFELQVQQHVARLRQEPTAGRDETLSSTLDVATLSAVGQEIKGMLKHIEEVLDRYFRDPTQKNALLPLGDSLHQVSGAFHMLELHEASRLADTCGKLVGCFATQAAIPESGYFEKIAESLSALGYLVDDAMREGASAEKSIAPFMADLEQVHQALLASAPQPDLKAEKPAAKPRARSKKVTDKAADAELLEIYLTEAEEVLGTIAGCLQELRADLTNQSALTEMRRGFHTLKGSGRTVGLTALGEVAWQVEQILNKLIENKQSPTLSALDFVGEVQTAFSGWIEQLKNAGKVAIDPEHWIHRAGDLERGAQTAVEAPPETPVAKPLASEPAVSATETVIVGGTLKVAKPLFDLFVNEARQNLDFLAKAVSDAKGAPTQRPDMDALRAAHTVSGTAKTTGIAPMAELAEALELWIEAHQDTAREWTADGWAAIERAVLALQLMLTRVAALRKPKAELSAIRALRVPALTATAVPSVPASPVTASAALPSSGQRLLDIFLEEARELFPLVGSELRDWKSKPEDPEPPRSLQRALHTLKGGARMAGEAALGDAIHDLETRVIQVLKSTPGEADFDQMFTELDDISRRMEVLDQATAPAPAATGVAAKAEPMVAVVQSLRVRSDILDELVNEAGEISISRSRIEREMGVFKHSLHDLTESVSRLRSYLRELEIEADSRLQAHESLLQEAGEAFDPLEFDRYTRLQELTRMMAESVNDVATTQHGLLDNLDETESALQDQMRMSRDLQQELMHIRMIPFSTISERLYRIVRQTSRELGSRVELAIDGAQAEIDRSVLEKIVAPLEHLLRNAIAHGIEPADQRVAAGKADVGHVALAVRQEKSEIIITVTDDGAGVNLDLVRQRAIERGLFEQDQQLNEQALMSVIFEPGFSTTSEVTQVAGRGVGLDVVRNDITMLGGRIDVSSQRGAGATFNIYLPATLTMSQVVLVRAGTHTIAIPSVMVEQVQQLKAAAINAAYEAGNIPWSGRQYPMHYLPRLIGDEAGMPEAQRSAPVLLLRSGTYHIALHVDEIIGNREVVVKRIGQQHTLVPGIVGATVLGDGRIMLILNPVQLANRAVLAAGAIHVSAVAQVEEDLTKTVLVVDDSLTMRKVLSRLLTREGYRVSTAKDGMEALQMLQEFMPDAVVLDIEMPRMDGFELARNIRDDQRTAELPLVVVSSRTADKHRNLAAEIGVNAYLGKPVSDDVLLTTLASLIGTVVA